MSEKREGRTGGEPGWERLGKRKKSFSMLCGVVQRYNVRIEEKGRGGERERECKTKQKQNATMGGGGGRDDSGGMIQKME